MKRALILAAMLAVPAAALGQSMPGMAMPGMAMPGMEMGEPATPGQAPLPPSDHYADHSYGTAAMDAARAQMMRESGARFERQLTVNLAELQLRDGPARYRWDAEAWWGGDIDRAVLKSEGSNGSAEAQALYSHAIDPYFDLQAGVRHDFRRARTYATVGIEGLAPYRVQTEASAYLSTRGEVLGRLEAWYDQRLTQRLVLQPRAELNLSAQDIPGTRVGAGLSDAELGLRLRYEIVREFAPYVGLSYDAKAGRSADYARADGKDPTSLGLVAGIRFWF